MAQNKVAVTCAVTGAIDAPTMSDALPYTASQMGGNVRVGLEDSLFVSRGKLAESNAQQVEKIRRIIEDLGSVVASRDEAREILQLKRRDRVAFSPLQQPCTVWRTQ